MSSSTTKMDSKESSAAKDVVFPSMEPPPWLAQLNACLDQKLSSLSKSVSTVESIIVNEFSKRDAAQSKLNALLLMQNETLIAMELKVLRLEAELQKHLKRRANLAAAVGPMTTAYPPITANGIPQKEKSTHHGRNPNAVSATGGAAATRRRLTPHPSSLASQVQQMSSSRRGNVKHHPQPSIKYSSVTANTLTNSTNPSISSSPATTSYRSSADDHAAAAAAINSAQQPQQQSQATAPAATFSWPSGASLASGVTGTSNEDGNVIFLMEDMDDLESATSTGIPRLLVEQETPQVVLEEEQVSDDDDENQDDEESMINDSDSTPTSRHSRSISHFVLQQVKIAPTLESLLEQQHQQGRPDEEEDVTVGAVRIPNDCDGCSSVASTSIASLSASAIAASTPFKQTISSTHPQSQQQEPLVVHMTPTLDALLQTNVDEHSEKICSDDNDDCEWVSTAAIRGVNIGDETSTLATSVTSATWTTNITATTRGSSLAAPAIQLLAVDDDDDDDEEGHDPEGNETIGTLETNDAALLGTAIGDEEGDPATPVSRHHTSSLLQREPQSTEQRLHSVEMVFDTTDTVGQELLADRKRSADKKTQGVTLSSRSHSPHDYFGLEDAENNMGNEGENSVLASVSVVSFSSTMAVAPPRAFTSRRAAAAAVEPSRTTSTGSTMTNRVVSFVHDPAEALASYSTRSEAGDSVTMPDELDNMSSAEVVDIFAANARRWREDYESRLEAIQKQLSGE